MKRLTVEKPVREMNMSELSHNCVYIKDGWVQYRDYDTDIDLLEFIRNLNNNIGASQLPKDREILEFVLNENLQYPLTDRDGLIAFIYNLMWNMAELRQKLIPYEDLGVTPEQIREIDKLYEEKCRKLAVVEPYIRLAEKLNLCDLVRENQRLAKELAYMGAAQAAFKKELDGYREAEEKGSLLRLPCEEGTTVYEIIECCSFGDPSSESTRIIQEYWFSLKNLRRFGKTIFFNREEAEAKLAEMEDAYE